MARMRPAALICAVTSLTTAALAMLVQFSVLSVWGQRRGASLLDILTKWDAQWFTRISQDGYAGANAGTERAEAFFPGYPILVRIIASPMAVLGVPDSTLIAAFIVSALACLVMVFGVSILSQSIYAATTRSDRHLGVLGVAGMSAVATLLTVGAPMGVIYWMPYSESLFTALAVWALVMTLRRRYLAAGALVMFAGITRLTAVALNVALGMVAVVAVWQWLRRRRTQSRRVAPWSAVAGTLLGSVGLVGYLAWATDRTRPVGGYFDAQDRGWGSHFDWGSTTWDWLSHNTINDSITASTLGYAIASWAMILVAALCAVTVWPLMRGWLPWPVWLTSIILAVVVLGSGGIEHSRPRLLLLATLLLLLPFAIRTIDLATHHVGRRRYLIVAGLATATGLWFALGLWVSGHMLIDFPYGI